MARCCGSGAKADDVIEFDPPPMRYPMWVLPVSMFLNMRGPPKSCQELMAEGLLVKWTLGMFCVFLSHQWLSNSSADPAGEQLSVFHEALLKILSGEVVVQSDVCYLAMFQKVEKLSSNEVEQLRSGFLWFDWFSIPQITVRHAGAVAEDVKDAVASIPAYVDAADLFVVLCPPAKHEDTQEFCVQDTWARRGWCLVELAAATLSRKSLKRMVVIHSPSRMTLMFPNNYLTFMPGQGDFTVDTDRVPLYQVMEHILDSHLQMLWAQGKKQLVRARLLTAMRGRFLTGLGTEKEQQELRDYLLCEQPQELLDRFQFQSMDVVEPTGVGPMMCAAVSGNLPILRHLVSVSVDIHQGVTREGQCNEILLAAGMTPFIAAVYYNGDVAVLKCLIELRADPHAVTSAGHSALFSAVSAGSVTSTAFLLDLGMDVETRANFGESPLSFAAGTGKVETISLLLQRRAQVNGPSFMGMRPLHYAGMFGKTAACRLLLKYQADVNAKATPADRAGRCMSLALSMASPFLPPKGPLRFLANIRNSIATQLAATGGHFEAVQLLVCARADAGRIEMTTTTAAFLQELEAAPQPLDADRCCGEGSPCPALFLEV